MRVLELAAAAEQRLTHPVAEAVIRYAEAQKVEILPRSKWDYQLGLGVQAEIDGQTVHVGSARFLSHHGVDMEKAVIHQNRDGSAIYVASNGELQGKIGYSDILRPESREVITALRTVEGVEIHMLTGDNWRTANAVAAQLGIPPTHTHAEAFPEQKAAVVRELHEQGKTVAFVGDGLNDSPALAYADVSVSFANGSDIARETADVVLMQNDLYGLLEAIEIARKAKQLIYQNTGIVAVPNLAALVIAVLFGLNPLAATVVNNGSTVVAGVNGLRPILTNRTDKVLPNGR
jgi:Cu2+-exporting ATPase